MMSASKKDTTLGQTAENAAQIQVLDKPHELDSTSEDEERAQRRQQREAARLRILRGWSYSDLLDMWKLVMPKGTRCPKSKPKLYADLRPHWSFDCELKEQRNNDTRRDESEAREIEAWEAERKRQRKNEARRERKRLKKLQDTPPAPPPMTTTTTTTTPPEIASKMQLIIKAHPPLPPAAPPTTTTTTTRPALTLGSSVLPPPPPPSPFHRHSCGHDQAHA